MKNKKKIIVMLVSIMLVCCILSGCEENTNSKEDKYTEESMTNALESVGLPNIGNYFERSQLKTIYELRDDPELICYWYTKNQMTGKWVFEGKCLGYGIPYGASMTSPDTLASGYRDSSVIAQAEPNGIYTNGVTSSATWVLTMNGDGSISPTYVEQEISVRQKDNKIDVSRCEEWSVSEDY